MSSISVTCGARAAQPDELMREAEAHQALAELFPHLKLEALRAIQDLFPRRAQSESRPALPLWH